MSSSSSAASPELDPRIVLVARFSAAAEAKIRARRPAEALPFLLKRHSLAPSDAAGTRALAQTLAFLGRFTSAREVLLAHASMRDAASAVLLAKVEALEQLSRTAPGLACRHCHTDLVTVDSVGDLASELNLDSLGDVAETDLDVVENDCEFFDRKRRDAEVLSLLAANADGPCLDLGTSWGRSTFNLAHNAGVEHDVFTVNILPEHRAGAGEQITHVLHEHDIGRYFRERAVTNVRQIFADTRTWEIPEHIRDLAVVFVDACHDTDAVLLDSRKTWPRLRAGGFLVWHDFSPFLRGRWPWIDSVMRGVEQFLDETLPRAEVFHLRHSWTGILRKPEA